MNKDNEYLKQAVNSWHIGSYTYCLIDASQRLEEEYMVRVIPDDFDEVHEGFWLNGGQTWETESGAAWSILTCLHQEFEK